jgi:hypothetical protein
MATRKKTKAIQTEVEQPLTDLNVGEGVNSTPEEIAAMGGLAKFRAKLKAKHEAAKNAEQPRTL